MRSAPALLATLIVFLPAASAAPQGGAAPPPPFGGSLEPGPHAVGFRVRHEIDATRPPVAGRPGRPLQIAIWYPAVAGGGTPMRYGDYVAIAGSELSGREDAETRSRALDEFRARVVERGASPAAVEAWMATSRPVRRDAQELGGQHPLVLVAQGNYHAVHHQAVLCELLASHGFVVATTPSQTRISGPLTAEEQVLPSAREQEADLAFARDRLRAGSDVAAGAYGLLAHSFGARSALLLAFDDPDVRALVSLDGGLANRFGEGWYRGDPSLDRARLRTTLLHVHQPGDRVVVPDFRLLESLLGSDRYSVEIAGLTHGNFNSYGWASAAFPGFAAAPTPGLGERLDSVDSLVVAFLRAELLGDRTEWDGMARRGMAATDGPRWRHLPPGRP